MQMQMWAGGNWLGIPFSPNPSSFFFFIPLHILLLSLNVRGHFYLEPDFVAKGLGNNDAKHGRAGLI